MALPTIGKTLGLSALAGLASEGASQAVKAMSGKGVQTGGRFIVNPEILGQLAPYVNLLTKTQLGKYCNAVQNTMPFDITLSKKQQGSGLGTILASIGIPMLLNALTGKGLQVSRSRSKRSLPVNVPPPTTSKKDGGLIIP